MIAALLRLLGMADPTSVLVTLAAVTVAALLLLAAAQVLAARHQARPSAIRTTLRERTLRTAFLPQRDPDAPGRPRPRAPGTKITPCSRSAPS
ncbi:DUF6412 domain-containing protein [Spirillospora sp. NPDC048911]|uniref:DUF6412 domain-containing protein n=1 Tax=Spirillospora sp. NPDC048911 TaxID=3364527 RepID=UPI0037173AEC